MNKWRDVLLSSKDMCWETPTKLFNDLDLEFHFVADICASKENAKKSLFYTEEDNAMIRSWNFNGNVFCNPPYGKLTGKFLEKAYNESKIIAGDIVMLVPARTDTQWFHNYVLGKAEIRFIKGRLKFEHNGIAGEPAPFPSMIVIYRGNKNV